MKVYLLQLFIIALFSANVEVKAQISFTEADSVLFENVKNDTLKLQELTNRLGERIALKAHNRLGYLAFKNKNYDKAIREFKVSKNSKSNSFEETESLYFLGRINIIRKNYDEALEQLQEYVTKDKKGDFAEGASYNIFFAMVKENKPNTDVEIKKFLQKNPHAYYAPHALYQLVNYYKNNDDYANAILSAKEMINKYPGTNYAKDFIYQIGDLYEKLGNLDEARNQYYNLTQEYAKNTEPAAIGQYLMAEVYEKKGNYEEARNEYAKVKVNNPNINNWTTLSEYAMALSYYEEYIEKRDSTIMGKAINGMTEFINIYPEDRRVPRASMILGLIYNEQKDWTNAIKTYSDVIGFDLTNAKNIPPENYEHEMKELKEVKENAFFARGTIYSNEVKKYDEALEDFNEVEKMNPERKDVLLNKSLTLINLGRENEARPILEELVSTGGAEGEAAEYYLSKIKKG